MFHPFVARDVQEDAPADYAMLSDPLDAALFQATHGSLGIVAVIQLVVVPYVTERIVLSSALQEHENDVVRVFEAAGKSVRLTVEVRAFVHGHSAGGLTATRIDRVPARSGHWNPQREDLSLFDGPDAAQHLGISEKVERADLIVGAPATPILGRILQKFGERFRSHCGLASLLVSCSSHGIPDSLLQERHTREYPWRVALVANLSKLRSSAQRGEVLPRRWARLPIPKFSPEEARSPRRADLRSRSRDGQGIPPELADDRRRLSIPTGRSAIQEVLYRYSSCVTRRTSETVVVPSRTLRQPSSRSVRIPWLTAKFLMISADERLRISCRTPSFIDTNSKIPLRPRYPVMAHSSHPCASYAAVGIPPRPLVILPFPPGRRPTSTGRRQCPHRVRTRRCAIIPSRDEASR